MNKFTTLTFAVLATLAMFGAKSAEALPIMFGFSANDGSTIVFTPDDPNPTTFDFVNLTDDDFTINNQTGGDGNLVGLSGNITGTFEFPDPEGANTVVVTTTNGTFTIIDASGEIFEAEIDFIELALYPLGSAAIGGTAGTLFFSSATYTGTNSDLLALAGAGNGPAVVSIDFPGSLTLNDLYAGTTLLDYSGSAMAAAVPEPATLGLLGVGLAGIGFALRRRREEKLTA